VLSSSCSDDWKERGEHPREETERREGEGTEREKKETTASPSATHWFLLRDCSSDERPVECEGEVVKMRKKDRERKDEAGNWQE
jgi:hypothetical protein